MTSWRSVVRVSHIPIFIMKEYHSLLQESQARMAAHFVGRAVLSLFPKAQLSEAFVSGGYFCREVFPNQEITKIHSDRIEERTASLLAVESVPEVREMMRENAMELFAYHGQKELVSLLWDRRTQTVKVVQTEEFYDLYWGPLSGKKNGKCKIIGIEPVSGTRKIRIFGISAPDKPSLKEALAAERRKEKRSHVKIGARMNLFHVKEKGCIFTLKGERLLHHFICAVERLLSESGFQKIYEPLPVPFSEWAGEAVNNRFEREKPFLWKSVVRETPSVFREGLLALRETLSSAYLFFCDQENLLRETTSCLQIYEEIAKIFGFSFEILLQGKKEALSFQKAEEALCGRSFLRKDAKETELVFSVKDRIGRIADQGFLRWTESSDGSYRADGVFFHSAEACMAVFLEKKEGIPSDSPFHPEKIRILVLERGESFAEEIYLYFKKKGITVSMDGTKEKTEFRWRKAFSEKVPYTVLIGEKESKTGMLTLRDLGSRIERECAKEELLALSTGRKLNNL